MNSTYGVKIFFKEIHVFPITLANTYKSPDYKYTVEVVVITNDNGNGLKKMNIYTNGELRKLEVGGWEISPIVKMPYNWGGNSVCIELRDKNGQIISTEDTPDERGVHKKKDYIRDILWFFELLQKLEKIENANHYDFYKSYLKIVKTLEFRKEHVLLLSIGSLLELTNEVKSLIDKFSDLKNELSKKNKDFTQDLLNEIIEQFNELKLAKITDIE